MYLPHYSDATLLFKILTGKQGWIFLHVIMNTCVWIRQAQFSGANLTTTCIQKFNSGTSLK